MIKRTLMLMFFAAAGVVFAHFASAGSCDMAGPSLATEESPKGECVCADSVCLVATATACANCSMFSAILSLETPVAPLVAMRAGIIAIGPMIGWSTLPEQPPPEAG